MKRGRLPEPTTKPYRASRGAAALDSVIWWLTASTVVLIPLVISVQAKDSFRVPKDLLFRAVWMVLMAMVIIRLLVVPRLPSLSRRDPVIWISAAVFLWSAAGVALSANRYAALESFSTIASYVFFALCVYLFSANRSLRVVAITLIPAVLNSLLCISQALDLWTPFGKETSDRLAITALLGNPNDIGMYLVPVALAGIALVAVSTGVRRAAFSLAVVIILGALLASQTLTAIVAAAAGAAAFFFVRFSPRLRLAVVVGFTVAAALGAVMYAPVRHRLSRVAEWIETGEYDRALSGRLTAFAAAAEMALDRPITGTGPGGFRWHYFDYKLRVEDRFPYMAERSMTRALNFGQVHNDHLQILAEAGLVGYGLFIAWVVVFKRRVSRAPAADEGQRWAKTAGLPFLTSLIVLMMAQFPMNLVTPAITHLYFAALILRWSHHETP